MTTEEALKIVTNYAIFMSKVYQDNFDTFAAADNFAHDSGEDKETRNARIDLMMSFSTVQGHRQRQTVGYISARPTDPKMSMNKLMEAIDLGLKLGDSNDQETDSKTS